jgi:hypothetical protein
MVVPKELTDIGPSRVRWLCAATRDAASQICSAACVDDTPELHCARFCLHLVTGAELPVGYAWEVLQAERFRRGRNIYLAAVEGYVCMLAMYAADLGAAGADLAEFAGRDNPELRNAAIFKFPRSPKALGDERIAELSHSPDPQVRAAVARTLKRRASPRRSEVLTRLIDDPVGSVVDAASFAAGDTKDPKLLDVLAAKGYLRPLNAAGDVRGRPCAEALAASDDPLNWGEGVWLAGALNDRELMAHWRRSPEWATRSNAIRVSLSLDLIDAGELLELLTHEPVEYVLDLILDWPQRYAGALPDMGELIRAQIGAFPDKESLRAGGSSVLDRARMWTTVLPQFSGAILRLVSEPTAEILAREMAADASEETRAVAARAIAHRGLSAGLPLVAELCIDPDRAVAEAAARAVGRARVRCGVYGLDTAVLKAGGDYSAGYFARHEMEHLIRAILGEGAVASTNSTGV